MAHPIGPIFEIPVDDGHVVAGDNRAGAVEQGQRPGEFFGHPFVVGIEKRDEVGVDLGDRPVPRGAGAASILAQDGQLDAFERRATFLDSRRRSVVVTVHDDNHACRSDHLPGNAP